MSDQIQRIRELEEQVYQLENSLEITYRCIQKYSGSDLKIRVNNRIVLKHPDLAKRLELHEIKR